MASDDDRYEPWDWVPLSRWGFPTKEEKPPPRILKDANWLDYNLSYEDMQELKAWGPASWCYKHLLQRMRRTRDAYEKELAAARARAEKAEAALAKCEKIQKL